MFYDYVDGGSWTEYTYRANEEDFGKIEFRQRVAVDITERSTASTMVGQPVSMPVAIAPTGLTGMQHADGEILAARAAQKFGIPFTLSTMSICPIEAVAEATGRHPFWFQLYVLRDRSFVEGLIEQCRQRELFRTRGHHGPAGLRPAAQGQEERPVDAPSADPAQPAEPREQAALVLEHAGHPASPVRQHRRAREGRGQHRLAGGVDPRAVRSPPVVAGHRMDQEALGRQADRQGHSGPRGCAAGGR